jgi:DNA repair protein SbcC/Rad50
MRPRELTLRGFRSYAEETSFDFTGRTLIGIFGPTGGGKSSILDAIAFALYGKTPRVERDTKSLINQRRNELHVSLVFDVDGTTWKAVRSLRRGGQSAHALYRVEDDGDHPVADRTREMGEQVEALLGLDFDGFRRSVLLAQNQFARFLEATPVERGTVLKGVFGFDRLDAMRDVTKRRLDSIGASLQVLKERRASAETDRSALPGKQEALTTATETATELRALRSAVGEVDETIREIEGAVAAAKADLASLDGLAALIPDREATEHLLQAAATADEGVAAAAASLESAAAAATAARERHVAALDAVGGQQALDDAADLVGRLDAARTSAASERARVGAAEAAVEKASGVAAAAEEARARAAAAADDAAIASRTAVAAEAAARDALHAAHAADRARSLRVGLVEGEPCPVCERVVTEVPEAGAAAELGDLERTVADAAAAAATAREAASTALSGVARVEADLEAAALRVTEAQAHLDAVTAAAEEAEVVVSDLAARVTSILGDGEPQTLLAELRSGIAGAADEARVAAEAETEARRLADEARDHRDRARAGLDRLRSDLANLAGRLGVDTPVGDTPAEAEEALRAVREEWLARRSAASEAQDRAAEELTKALDARSGLLEAAGLGPVDDLVEVVTEADKAVTALATEVELVEKRLAELDRLDEGESGLVEQADLLERLHSDLKPSGFLDYVLTERRRALADLAGDHFETLTAGRYRFSDDGDFNVLDMSAAEGKRAPASLSGGETFLASLSLALALAEIVGRQGGRLDAFFIDEGFGSLDAEHVDLAMDGVERLVTAGPDRLVVVVSHLDAMRDRIEDLIVLSRHPITDHTVVEAGATR